MRIKSLLLGSAAASMVAVSGAQAADAIVTYVEPEPMEYVRVCDVYGAGFFYIPGTETCLSISGFARYQLGAVNSDGGLLNYHGMTPDRWNKNARGRLNFDARSETEWGTLRGFVRIEGDGGQAVNTAGAGQLRWVFVSLGTQQGELLAGYLESAWAWAGPIGNYGMHSDTGGAYGFQRRSQIRYSFSAAEGFFGVLSVEDNTNTNHPGVIGQAGRFMPDIVAKAGISQAWGGVYGAIAYDAADSRTATSRGSVAARVGAQINVPNAPGSSLIAKFFWSNSQTNIYTPSLGGWSGSGARWSAMASYQHQFTPEFAAAVGYQYIRHFNGVVAPNGVVGNNGRTHLADLSLIWTPVENLEVRTEFGYARTRGNLAATGARASTPNAYSGFLRFQRNF